MVFEVDELVVLYLLDILECFDEYCDSLLGENDGVVVSHVVVIVSMVTAVV